MPCRLAVVLAIVLIALALPAAGQIAEDPTPIAIVEPAEPPTVSPTGETVASPTEASNDYRAEASTGSISPAGDTRVIDGPAPGVRQHDGFFLNLQAGPSYLSLSLPDGSMEIRGPGAGLYVAIGGTPIENFVIFGEIVGQSATSPELKLDGVVYDSNDSVSLSFSQIGPGAAYFFGESSFFVSGSIGFADATLETPSGKASGSGWGFRIGAGKEWWIGEQWGLGLGAHFLKSFLKDDDNSDELGGTSFGLNLSATFH